MQNSGNLKYKLLFFVIVLFSLILQAEENIFYVVLIDIIQSFIVSLIHGTLNNFVEKLKKNFIDGSDSFIHKFLLLLLLLQFNQFVNQTLGVLKTFSQFSDDTLTLFVIRRYQRRNMLGFVLSVKRFFKHTKFGVTYILRIT